MNTDRNLLFGILALQNNFISREQLVEAMHAWTLARDCSLGDLLRDRGALGGEEYVLLDALVKRQLAKHDGDVQKSLHALALSTATRAVLNAVPDADVQASLAALTTGDTTTDLRPERGDGIRYRVLRPHARGGLGEVFVAEDVELHREVALKEMQPKHADDMGSRGRFLLEAEITGRLEHPGIVPVYGLGNYGDGRPFYAMRFIKGDNLKHAIDRFHAAKERFDSVTFRQLLRRFLDVCNAIAFAHARGVLHRDLKPGNIMLGEFGETLVVDWGLAKVVGRSEPTAGEATIRPSSGSSVVETVAGVAIGTPAYMSPEQAEGKLDTLGPATDVYSLGGTLLCLLTGAAPIADGPLAEVVEKVRRGEIVPAHQRRPGVPRALSAICTKAMALSPADRYASAQALAGEIEHWLADEPVIAYHEPLTVRAGRWVRKHRTLVTATAAALVVALVGASVALSLQSRQNRRLENLNTELETANARADTRFQQAREAVDEFYTEVSENPRLLQKEPGTQQLRKTLLEKAKRYYENFAAENADDPRLRVELARAHLRLGGILTEIAPSPAVAEEYRKAIALCEQLRAAEPDEPAHVFRLAQAYQQLASLYYFTDKVVEGVDAGTKSQELLVELVGRDPKNTGYRSTLANDLHVMGNLELKRGRNEEALAHYRKSAELKEELARIDPTFERPHATYNNIGVIYRLQNKVNKAIETHTKAYEIRKALVEKSPNDRNRLEALATSLSNLGYCQSSRERDDLAIPHHREAIAILEKLWRENPDLVNVGQILVRAYENYLVVIARSEITEESIVLSGKSLGVAEELVRRVPSNPTFKFLLMRTLNASCLNMLFGGTDVGKVAERLARGDQLHKELQKTFPNLAELDLYSAGILAQLGYVAEIRGNKGEALQAYGRACAAYASYLKAHPGDGYATPESAIIEFRRAVNLRSLGKDDEALGALDRSVEADASMIAEALSRSLKVKLIPTTTSPSDYFLQWARELQSLEGKREKVKKDKFSQAAIAVLNESKKRKLLDRDALKMDPTFAAIRDTKPFQDLLADPTPKEAQPSPKK